MGRLLTLLTRLGIAGLVIGIVLGVFLASIFASVFPGWTGFAADPLPPGTAATPVVMYDQDKELWDWLQLLLVPLVLAVGGYWLTRTENRYAIQRQQEENHYALKLQERQEKEARSIEAERAQDAALQAYLDHMTQLLLHEGLLTSEPGSEVRIVARSRTITALRMLDGARKGAVIQFLYEAKLIGGVKSDAKGGFLAYLPTVIELEGADLQGAKLSGIFCSNIKLKGVNLTGADLTDAIIIFSDFTGADLRGAILKNTSFRDNAFFEANLVDTNLWGIDPKTFEGAKLFDYQAELARAETLRKLEEAARPSR